MKVHGKILFIVAALAVVLLAMTKTRAHAVSQPDGGAAIDRTSYAIGHDLGVSTLERLRLDGVEFDRASLVKGVLDALEGRDAAFPPEDMAASIRHAGAIFMGRHTAEALGDYCAGPNHVLPTSRTARFSSPLGVYDFQKRSSMIMASPKSAAELAKTASVLARGEGLTAHARSAEYRGASNE